MNHIRSVFAGLWFTTMAMGFAAMAEEWQAPPWTPLERVRLGGVCEARLQRAWQRLHTCPLDDQGYVLADLSLDRKRIFTEYSGDISGRMIGVEAFLSRYSTEERAALRKLLELAPLYQQSDGHFGAPQHLPAIDRSTDMPILWGNGRMLIGLIEAYEQMGDPDALRAARKLGDYFLATDKIYCRPENLKQVGGNDAEAFSTCYFSCIEGLVGLTRNTGDPRYGQQAERIADLALTVQQFDNLHSHGRLSALRGIVDLYALTRDLKWLSGAEGDWQRIVQNYRLPTGGITERFSRSDPRDEGCAVADWLRLNLDLWRVTGKGVYLDEAERCLKNHFLYQQYAAGGAGHRSMTIINGEPAAFRSGGVDAYWCCCQHWPRALVDVARLAVTTAPDGARVNLFTDAECSLVDPRKHRWSLQTKETANGLLIEVKGDSEKGSLHVHRPAWAGKAVIRIPRGCALETKPDEWIISGRWQGARKVEVQLPMEVREERTAGGATVFFCGYDMLVAHAVPANAWAFQSELKSPLEVSAPRTATRQGKTFLVSGSIAGGTPPRTLALAPMRQRDGSFPHQCWFAFNATKPVNGNASGFAAVSAKPLSYLTVGADLPAVVFLNGKEVARIDGWQSPLERFLPCNGKGNNTLLIICAPATQAAFVPSVIAGICGNDGRAVMGKAGWTVKALTLEEARQGAAEGAAQTDWQPVKKCDLGMIPSRENLWSPLEDLSQEWLSGDLSLARPVLAFRLVW